MLYGLAVRHGGIFGKDLQNEWHDSAKIVTCKVTAGISAGKPSAQNVQL